METQADNLANPSHITSHIADSTGMPQSNSPDASSPPIGSETNIVQTQMSQVDNEKSLPAVPSNSNSKSPTGVKRKRSHSPSCPSPATEAANQPVADATRPQHATKTIFQTPQQAEELEVEFALEEEDESMEDDGQEEDDDENDEGSQFSEGGDLYEALEAVLDSNFNFQGGYYHASTSTNAPNPCLAIEGLGSVGLPLSVRDAEYIKAVSAQAPFGHGTKTLVDKTVRDTWEIEPGRISFLNPAWNQWISSSVVPTVCTSLGVPPTAKTHCNLYKMLLYEQGSHFLAHQDTQKEEGMFATIVIVLPCTFSGGQVHLSHSSQKKVLDFSQDSMIHTSIAAWYTDVTHEVKPITSGWRLALSYNLIAAAGAPQPSLPDISPSIMQFRHVLRKWHEKAYRSYGDGDGEYVAYILEHQYSNLDLQKGFKSLKGRDAHTIRHIKTVAEEQGYMICLASLTHTKHGTADDSGYSYYKRGRWGRCYYDNYSDGEDSSGQHTMEEVIEEDSELENICDLDGLLLKDCLRISKEGIIPQNAFENEEPDDEDYEGYTGNAAGTLDHFYHRTVMLIMPDSRAGAAFFSSGGVDYPLKKLQTASNPPSPKDLRWVDLIIPALRANPSSVPMMAAYAILWNDLYMWQRIMTHGQIDLKKPETLMEGWRAFTFDGVHLAFQQQLDQCKKVGDRLLFIEFVRMQAANSEVAELTDWAAVQTQRVLDSLHDLTPEDACKVVPLCLQRGVAYLRDTVVPKIVKASEPRTIYLAFVSEIHQAKLLPNPDGETKHIVEFEQLIVQLLTLAVPLWKPPKAALQPHAYGYPYYGRPALPPPSASEVDNIMSIVDACLLTKDLTPCHALFTSVLRNEGTTKEKFTRLFRPLVPRLKASLRNAAMDLATIPFQGFFQILITLYLRDVLPKPPPMPHATKKMTCNCSDCLSVNAFLVSDRKSVVFKMAQYRRNHVQSMLRQANVANVSQTGYGKSGGLQVTKRPEAMLSSEWKTARDVGRKFIAEIGDSAVLRQILGEQGFQNVMKDLNTLPSPAPPVASSSTGTSRLPINTPRQLSSAPRPSLPSKSSAPRALASNALQQSATVNRVAVGSVSKQTLAPPKPAAHAPKPPKKVSNNTGVVIDLTLDD